MAVYKNRGRYRTLQNGQGRAKFDILGMSVRADKGKIIQSAIWPKIIKNRAGLLRGSMGAVGTY